MRAPTDSRILPEEVVEICIRAPRPRNSAASGTIRRGALLSGWPGRLAVKRSIHTTDVINWYSWPKQASTPITNTSTITPFSHGLDRKTGPTVGKTSLAPIPTSPSTISIMTIWRSGWEKCGVASRSNCSIWMDPALSYLPLTYKAIAAPSQQAFYPAARAAFSPAGAVFQPAPPVMSAPHPRSRARADGGRYWPGRRHLARVCLWRQR